MPSSTTTAIPTCTTAVPGKYGYIPPDACNSNWAYAPSFIIAVVLSVLFGITTLSHLGLAFLHRKGFCWVIIMGSAWELAAFVLRAMGAHKQDSLPIAFVSTVLFLLAPLWVNAFAYMTAGRLIYTFHPEKRVWKVKAMSIGKYFVWLDILSFLVQLVGGMMLSPGNPNNVQKLGKNIYMCGVGVQQLFILLFTALIVRFHIEALRFQSTGLFKSRIGGAWQWLTIALYVVLALITIRICYRLAEFSAGSGTSNPLPYHEVYAIVLDAIPMFLAIATLALLHPGMFLQGPESEFPSRKQRKADKKAKKAAKKEAKAAKKYGPLPQSGSGDELDGGDVELGVVRNN